MPKRFRIVVVACAIALMVALRLAALASDPYVRLDWSAGLLTDEGFYIHNARNVVLFGRARTDEFNNMLLAPLLHFVQTSVFSHFGVGAVQARSISVVCSLLTLALFYSALRRAFDERVALTATVFLGLDHTNLLYNRMALMDTPAALPAVAAFYAFVRATQHVIDPQNDTERHRTEHRRTLCGSASFSGFNLTPRLAWLVLCGLLVGLTVASRMLCAYLLPVPLVALLRPTDDHRPSAADHRPGTGDRTVTARIVHIIRAPWMADVLAVAGAMAAVFAAYAVLWYLPRRVEIVPMARYYRINQIQPSSLAHLAENVQHALFGDFRGLAPYLFRHTPALFALTILGIGYSGVQVFRRSGGESFTGSSAYVYLMAWMLLGWILLAAISYSPSRYYVTTYPAMAALAAIGLWQLPVRWADLWAERVSARLARGALAGFLTFHAGLAIVHYRGVVAPALTMTLLYGLPALAAVAVQVVSGQALRRHAVALALAGWLLVNAWWLGDWMRRIGYTQHEESLWLARNLPVGSVLIGDVAPGVSLDNPFKVIHVQPGLCNGKQPVEREAGAPRYVVILDGRSKEDYWLRAYPELVRPERRIQLARVLRWDVGVYAVDGPATMGAR